MKRILLLIYILVANCIALSAVGTSEIKDLAKDGNAYFADASNFLKSINPASPENQANYAGVGADVKSNLQQSYNLAYDNLQQLYNKFQDPNASKEDLQKLLSDSKNIVGGLTKDLSDNLKNNQYIKELKDQYDVLDGKGTEIINKLKEIKDFGFSFNTPIGFEGTFGEVNFHVSLGNIEMERGEKPEDNRSKAVATVRIYLPFLPEQEGESNSIGFKGDIFFKKGDPKQRSRILLENEAYTIPIIKDKADLVFVRDPNYVKNELGQCSLPDESEDGGNFVEFDCNGITAVHLQGYVHFKDYLVAMTEGEVQDKMPEEKDENGNVKPQPEKNTNPVYTAWVEKAKKDVYAVFSLDAKGGFVSKLCFSSPFKIKDAKNFVFDVKDAVIDLSTIKNAADFELPAGYLPAGFSEINWTGFALKELTCYFPEDFKLNDNAKTARPMATVYDMFIDDYGFTGKAMAKKLVDKTFGNAGANISLDYIAVEFWQNEFVNGEMNGKASIPFLKKIEDGEKPTPASDENTLLARENNSNNVLEFDYSVRISLATDVSTGEKKYGFAGKAATAGTAGQTYQVPFTDMATVTINPGTGVYISNYYNKVESVTASTKNQDNGIASSDSVGRLVFRVVLNGSLNIESGKLSKTKGSGVLGFDCKFEGIAFEGLTFKNVGQKVSIDRLALKGKLETKFLGMTLTLNKLGWSNGEPTIDKKFEKGDAYGGLLMDAKIQIIPSGSGNIAPDFGGLFKTFYGHARDVADKVDNWHFGGIDVNHIGLDADIGVLKLKGDIDLYKDDDVFGKGFKGNVELTIDPIDITAGVQACFGTTNDKMKYWFTKASCSFPGDGLPVFSGLYLKSLTGGAYYHMKDTVGSSDPNTWKEEYGPDEDPPFIFADVCRYKPDPDIKLGLIAGVGLNFGGDNLATLNAELNIRFAGDFALDQITIGGDFSMITPVPKFVTKAAEGLNKVKEKMQALADQALVCSNLPEQFLKLTDPKDGRGNDILGDIAPSNGTIHGWAKIDYIPSAKFFNLNSAVKAEFGKFLEGYASVNMRISPEKWYFRIGSDTYPAYLKVLGGIAEGKTYFMTGVLPSPTLKPLSPNAAKQFENVSYGTADMSSGKKASGMAFAVNARVDLNFDDFPLIFAGFYLEGGCDLLLTDCNNPDSPAKWRGQGSIYGDIGVKLGVNFYFFKITVIEGNAFLGLQGGAPTPVQGNAIASFHVEVGSRFNADVDLKVHVGKKDKVVCN
ncbi:MAG: hypothetical protein J5875_13040 [Paludibacteraceae bacterium]|nr:hypothetical protein [Paludibacteraceae bacterium]